jgi:hypothetical protein
VLPVLYKPIGDEISGILQSLLIRVRPRVTVRGIGHEKHGGGSIRQGHGHGCCESKVTLPV